MSDLDLTTTDQNQVHAVQLGESVSIRLPEIGGTAFLWHVELADGLDVIEDSREFDHDAPGSQSNRHLVFRTNRAGRATLQLHRYRPWESTAEADASAIFVFDTGVDAADTVD